MPKKETHHTGKHTGYDLIDGKYFIAPVYINQFEKLAAQKHALKNLLKHVNDYFIEVETVLNEASMKLWEELQDDIGLDKTVHWRYDGNEKYISQKDIKEGTDG